MTPDIEACIYELFDQDPLEHGDRSSHWNCRELSQAVAAKTGVSLKRERVRVALKKRA